MRVLAEGKINWIEFFRKKLDADKPTPQAVAKPEPATPIEWSLGK